MSVGNPSKGYALRETAASGCRLRIDGYECADCPSYGSMNQGVTWSVYTGTNWSHRESSKSQQCMSLQESISGTPSDRVTCKCLLVVAQPSATVKDSIGIPKSYEYIIRILYIVIQSASVQTMCELIGVPSPKMTEQLNT